MKTIIFPCAHCGSTQSEFIAKQYGHSGYCSNRCKKQFWITRPSTQRQEWLLKKINKKHTPGGLTKKQKRKLINKKRNATRERIKKQQQLKIEYGIKSEAFLKSREWRELRFEAFLKYGRICKCCGAKPPEVVLHVDHIKSRYRYPELALDLNNLQVLCSDCNRGKGIKEADFRESEEIDFLTDSAKNYNP